MLDTLDGRSAVVTRAASEAGLVTNDFIGAHRSTKHAAVGPSESLRREIRPRGVEASCLCPNLIDTRIFESERNRGDRNPTDPHVDLLEALQAKADGR